MKKITITLYSFDELPPEVQEKVLDDNRTINVDYGWYDFVYDSWKEKTFPEKASEKYNQFFW